MMPVPLCVMEPCADDVVDFVRVNCRSKLKEHFKWLLIIKWINAVLLRHCLEELRVHLLECHVSAE